MNRLLEFARQKLRAEFSKITRAKGPRPPMQEPGFETITFTSGDGTPLAGWIYRPPGRKTGSGTVILSHGFCDHSGSLGTAARELSTQHGLVALAFDHRLHGSSEDHIPSFGGQESFDIQAALDFADRVGLPRPYLLHGTSLGALAAQRAGIKDPRVAGLFLVACPGWPWDAIGVMSRISQQRLMLPAGNLVNLYYGWDVLNDGDIRRHRQPESHTPFVCYVMGEADCFGVSKTRLVYDHWQGAGAENRFPSETPGGQKWFWTLPQVVHPGTPGPQVWEWSGYGRLQQEFFERVLTGGIAG